MSPDDWDPRETNEITRDFAARGITLRAVGDELEVSVSGRLRAADHETLCTRRWDLIRHCRGENTRGLRFDPDGKRYRWLPPELPRGSPRQTVAQLD